MSFISKVYFYIIKHSQRNLLLYLITIAALLARFFYQTPYLEDWDSVQFALGLHNYSVVLHQPHPPGYPLYILLGKIVYLITQNSTQALTFLSVIFGSLSVIPLFLLTKRMFSQSIAYLTIIIFILTPVGWILSEVANSNMTGLFFVLLLAYLIYSSSKQSTKAILIGIIAAITLGIRFTDFPIVITLLALSIIKNHSLKYSAYLILSFFLGISLWLIPLLLISGPKEFYEAYRQVANYVTWHDMLLGQSYTMKHLIKVRLEMLWQLLQAAFTQIFLFISIVSLIIFCLKKKLWGDFRFYFLLAWLLSYLLPLIFFYNLELPQYTLPLLPIFAIISAYIITSIIKNQLIIVLSIVTLAIFLFSQSWPQVKYQAQDLPPTIAPVIYLEKNYSPENTLLITTFTYRQFQYYAPQFENYYGPGDLPNELKNEYIVIDYEGLKREVPQLAKYQVVSSYSFKQNHPLNFPRLQETKLYILKRI